MNDKIRLSKHLEPKTFVQDEKIIVLRNNLNEAVFNGMILFVKKIIREEQVGKFTKHLVWTCDCEDEIGKHYELPIWQVPYKNPELIRKDTFIPREVVYSTYGYVITCHKSQGSEWDKLMVFDEWMPPRIWDMKRWRYTAITRAAKQLIYCM
jgi:exodeoxyribonuclease-5